MKSNQIKSNRSQFPFFSPFFLPFFLLDLWFGSDFARDFFPFQLRDVKRVEKGKNWGPKRGRGRKHNKKRAKKGRQKGYCETPPRKLPFPALFGSLISFLFSMLYVSCRAGRLGHLRTLWALRSRSDPTLILFSWTVCTRSFGLEKRSRKGEGKREWKRAGKREPWMTLIYAISNNRVWCTEYRGCMSTRSFIRLSLHDGVRLPAPESSVYTHFFSPN